MKFLFYTNCDKKFISDMAVEINDPLGRPKCCLGFNID